MISELGATRGVFSHETWSVYVKPSVQNFDEIWALHQNFCTTKSLMQVLSGSTGECKHVFNLFGWKTLHDGMTSQPWTWRYQNLQMLRRDLSALTE